MATNCFQFTVSCQDRHSQGLIGKSVKNVFTDGMKMVVLTLKESGVLYKHVQSYCDNRTYNDLYYRLRSREIMYLVASVRQSVRLFVCTLPAEPFDLDIWHGGRP